MSKISIEDLITAVRLVKKDTCADFATTGAVAKMLGVRKMDVLLFMEENPKLIHAEERFNRRRVNQRVRGFGILQGKTWTEERFVNGASLGLCITDAFPTADANPWNEEWLDAAKERYAKTLWLSEVDNYGEILGHCFREDVHPSSIPSDHRYQNNSRNTWLWRNTREKLEAAKALGGCRTVHFCMGSFGDSYTREEPYTADAESLAILKQNGYQIL